MNEIKAFGPQLQELCEKIEQKIVHQWARVEDGEYERMEIAEPHKWVDSGKQKLQEGLMCLTRAIAQPTFF